MTMVEGGPRASACREVISLETTRLCEQLYRERLRAVVLTGSVARNEGTVVRNDRGSSMLGDAEFLLVFDERTQLPNTETLRVVAAKLEERIAQRGMRGAICLSAVHPGYLRRLSPSIFAYELLTNGKVVHGEPSILSLVPRFSPDQIPREDAWRLLANRMLEQLDDIDEILDGGSVLSSRLQYRTVKLYLDMATSLLVFSGCYAPTYRQRAVRLRALAKSGRSTLAWPFPIERFADSVARCTQWKLNPERSELEEGRGFLDQAINDARALWRWELAQLTGLRPDTSVDMLMRQWAGRQKMSERLRGWASLVRREGWLRSLPAWPRWLRLAARCSPRYAIYRAGALLFFSLPPSGGSRPPLVDPQFVDRFLPVPLSQPSDDPRATWRRITCGVTNNYSSFLVGTRS
jgi:hypothetical protein